MRPLKPFTTVILDGLNDLESVDSFLFWMNWNPEEFLENPKIRQYKDDLLAGGNCIFECEGRYLHQKSMVRKAWENYSQDETGDKLLLSAW